MAMKRSLAVDRFRVHLSSVYDPIPTMKCERKETISVFKNVGVKETMYIQNHIRILCKTTDQFYCLKLDFDD